MKKPGLVVMIALTVAFVAVLVGIFVRQTQTLGLTDLSAQDDVDRGKVNLNTATKEELMVLPGIGEGLAQRIIDYRERYGPYRKISELENVKGISKNMVAQMADYITVGG